VQSSALKRLPPESHVVCVRIPAKDKTECRSFHASHLPAGSHEAGSVAVTGEGNKTLKYDNIISGVDFVPVAIEASGVGGKARSWPRQRDWSSISVRRLSFADAPRWRCGVVTRFALWKRSSPAAYTSIPSVNNSSGFYPTLTVKFLHGVGYICNQHNLRNRLCESLFPNRSWNLKLQREYFGFDQLQYN